MKRNPNNLRGINEPLTNSWKRFWNKVKIGNRYDCWDWTGGCDLDGYGLFKLHRKGQRAARAYFLMKDGNIPNGLWVLHTCDNPKCLNPKHLFLGTPSDNSKDRERKGRGRPTQGESNGYSKLTKRDVISIRFEYGPPRALWARGNPSCDELAKKYHVSRAAISLIVRRKIWDHI